MKGVEGSPGVGSFNKKFLAPNSPSAGKFTGNVYRPTEEFRQGQGWKKKAPTTSAHTATVRGFKVQD